MKRLSIFLVALMLLLSVTACSSGGGSTGGGGNSTAAKVIDSGEDIIPADKLVKKTNGSDIGYQLDAPTEGEEIAVITVKDFGDIKLRFFADEAPKTVYSFKKNASNGYYDGVIFHRIIEDFMVQGGDPDGTGAGGTSIWGEAFEDEFQPNLVNITGSVAMANSGPATNGSQFFINNKKSGEVSWDYLQEGFNVYKESPDEFTANYGNWVDMDKVTDAYKELYNEHLGSPTLDGFYSTTGKGHTVFAQVFEGMDVVDKISSTDTDSSDRPIDDVIIEKIEIVNMK